MFVRPSVRPWVNGQVRGRSAFFRTTKDVFSVLSIPSFFVSPSFLPPPPPPVHSLYSSVIQYTYNGEWPLSILPLFSRRQRRRFATVNFTDFPLPITWTNSRIALASPERIRISSNKHVASQNGPVSQGPRGRGRAAGAVLMNFFHRQLSYATAALLATLAVG